MCVYIWFCDCCGYIFSSPEWKLASTQSPLGQRDLLCSLFSIHAPKLFDITSLAHRVPFFNVLASWSVKFDKAPPTQKNWYTPEDTYIYIYIFSLVYFGVIRLIFLSSRLYEIHLFTNIFIHITLFFLLLFTIK